MSGLLVIGGVVIANGSLGAVVALRNSGAALNRIFLGLLVMLSLWAITSTLSDSTANYTLARYASFVAFGGGFLSVYWAYLFAAYFRFSELKPRHIWMTAAAFFVAALFSTPLVYDLKTLETYQNGILYVPYLVSIMFFLLLAIHHFMQVIRTGNTLKKNHARFMLFGVAVTIILAITTNAIIPLLTPITWPTRFGPLFTIIFISAVAYSIIRHKLFDIRAIVARSLAYILSVTVIVTVYTVVVFGVIENAFNLAQTSATTKVVYSVMAIILATTFAPIKKFFDRLTTKVFYRDDYSVNRVLDQMGEAIAGTMSLVTLAHRSLKVLDDAIKAEYISIQLVDETQQVYKQFAVGKPNNHIAAATEAVAKAGHGLLIVNELTDEKANDLGLKAARADVVIALKMSRKNIGYLMFGYKQNGSAYREKDMQLMTVAADELALAIQNTSRFEEIKLFNETLQDRINSATNELRISNKKLHVLDKSKDEFISMASHQLRTPLTAVKGYLSMLLDGDIGPVTKEQRQVLEQAYDSSQRMVFLIGDFLNVSRIQTGKFVLEMGDINLADLIPEEIDQLVDTAKARQIEIKYEKSSSLPKITADENKLRQVMMNFMDNAIYYSRANSVINVQLYKDADSVIFKVIDTGIGVPKSEQPRLFTKFYRATNAKQQRPDGTGIGLYMAKKVIVAHGGSVIFETQEGVGSTFGFKLPLKYDAKQLDKKPRADYATAGNHRS